MHRKRTAILSHILLVVLCILIRLPGEKEVQQPYAMYCAIAVMECLYLIRITRHREQLRAASDLMVLLWGFLILANCAVYAIFWQQNLKRFPVNVAYAHSAVYNIWSLIWAVLIFSETINRGNVIGTFLIIAGILLIRGE